MGHQADDIAALVGDPRDGTKRTVRVLTEVTSHDSPLPLEPVQRRPVRDETTFTVLENDRDLGARVVLVGPRGRVVLDPQQLVAADELAVVVADQRTRQQVRLTQDLEAVADAEHRHPLLRRLDYLGHHRSEARDRACLLYTSPS